MLWVTKGVEHATFASQARRRYPVGHLVVAFVFSSLSLLRRKWLASLSIVFSLHLGIPSPHHRSGKLKGPSKTITCEFCDKRPGIQIITLLGGIKYVASWHLPHDDPILSNH